jgi:glycerol-3-phosphate dehydrogenase
MPDLSTGVVVIGGGSTGAGVLRDLAMRGVDAVLVEKGDLASGTTGRSHGLLHSGGRYCVNDQQAAIECVEEGRILRKIARSTIEDTGGYFVSVTDEDREWEPRFVEGCRRAGITCERISVDEARRADRLLAPGGWTPRPLLPGARQHGVGPTPWGTGDDLHRGDRFYQARRPRHRRPPS